MQFGRIILVALFVFAILGVIDYELLRWIVGGVTCYLIYKEFDSEPGGKISGELFLYLLILIIYNPLTPVYLYSRGLWIIIDLIFLGFLVPLIFKDIEKERPINQHHLIDELATMTDGQRRNYLDEALKYDSLSMNSWDYEKYEFLAELEVEEILKETAIIEVNQEELEISIDEIIGKDYEISESVSHSDPVYWSFRSALFTAPDRYLFNDIGWKIFNSTTNDLIGVGFIIKEIRQPSEIVFKDFISKPSNKETIEYHVMFLTFPEFLSKNIENVEGKLLKHIEQKAINSGIEKLSINVSRVDYVDYFYRQGYRYRYKYYINSAQARNILESGAWSFLELEKPLSQNARKEIAEKIMNHRRYLKWEKENRK